MEEPDGDGEEEEHGGQVFLVRHGCEEAKHDGHGGGGGGGFHEEREHDDGGGA